MNLIVNKFNEFRNNHSLFSLKESFDWHDGFISGLVKLRDSNETYFFNLLSVDFISGMKIFLLLNVNEAWEKKFNNQASNSMHGTSLAFFLQYTGKCYLIHARDIEETSYDLIEIEKENSKYYSGIEEMLNEQEEVKTKWVNYFGK